MLDLGARRLSRRGFLHWSLATAVLGPTTRPAAQHPPPPGWRLVRTLELGGREGAQPPPFDRLLGDGLDARLFTDLSRLRPQTLVTDNERFFIRTACPSPIVANPPRTIHLGGVSTAARDISIDELRDLARPMGTHLVECSGNSDPSDFGLIGAARWDGVPVATLLDRITPSPSTTRVLVSGIDDLTRASRTSVPGASWIFARDDLDRAGAFLATGMNGAPLPRDHGWPVRLLVPGWYGCASIKWVDRIELVSPDAPPTSQMREFAGRTHQDGVPALAREFQPAIIDTAAMPIRVEQWQTAGGFVYRVVGIIWGGTTPTNALEIRFRYDEPFFPVSDCPMPSDTRTWSLWSHLWRPTVARRYQIVLRVADPAIRTRRLDVFFYTREVTIEEPASVG